MVVSGRHQLGGAKKRAADAVTVLEWDPDSESIIDLGGEEESRGASESSGSEWSGAEE